MTCSIYVPTPGSHGFPWLSGSAHGLTTRCDLTVELVCSSPFEMTGLEPLTHHTKRDAGCEECCCSFNRTTPPSTTAFPPPMTNLNERWLPTGQAATALGVSVRTLKRYADVHCFLIEGDHWRFGPLCNSPRQWNVSACAESLSHRGRISRLQRAGKSSH